MVSLTVKKTYEGMELIDVLEKAYPDYNKNVMIKTFKDRDITLNGHEARADDKVQEGDKVRIFVTADKAGIDLTPRVIYQDENFVIIDKPAGLPSTSDSGELNAVGIVEEFMKQRGEYSLQALMLPYLIYSLEKYVSGVLIIAKHEDAYQFLSEAISQRRVSKFFVCPIRGQAKENEELLAYLMQDNANKRVSIIKNLKKGAKPVVTRYSTLSVGKGMSLICARPITNYLHQVRAHLAFDKLPIVGDEIYGDKRFNRMNGADTIALWLKTVVFEIGVGHGYAYLNGKSFESKSYSFPMCVYDAGLLEQ